MQEGKIYLISGPSGVGKGTIREHILSDEDLKIELSVSCTTRKPRQGEVDGVDYCELNFRLEDDDGNLVPITIDVMAPLKTPTLASKLIKCSFVDGVFTKQFKTLTSGTWMVPTEKPKNFRFFDQPVILKSFDDGDIV